MTQYAQEELEQQVREALRGTSLEPDSAEVQRLDQQLPPEWTHLLEPELDPLRNEFTEQELQRAEHAPLEVPNDEEVDTLVQEATKEVDLDELFKVDVPQQSQAPEINSPEIDGPEMGR